MTVSTNASSGPNKTISPDDIVTLQVRQKTFTIRAGTLAEDIHFFEEVFFGDAASSMQALQRTAEGAYIVEADPKIFKHIINYCLFLTGPLFYEKGTRCFTSLLPCASHPDL